MELTITNKQVFILLRICSSESIASDKQVPPAYNMPLRSKPLTWDKAWHENLMRYKTTII